MTDPRPRSFIPAALLLSAALSCGPAEERTPADRVLLNGAVYTMDEDGSRAEAVVVRGDRIVFVGSSEEARAFVGPETEVVDLEGKMVLPGFVDSHVHPAGATVKAVGVDLYGGGDLESYLEAVRRFAESHPDAAVIRGMGWSNAAFPPTGPRKKDLDGVVSDRPVVLTSGDAHSAWVNSKALDLAGITNDTPNPEGGLIERDPDGEATGTLRESAASDVAKMLPPFTTEERMEGLLAFQKMASSYGITTMHDAALGLQDIGSGGDVSAADAYEKLQNENRLDVRFRASILFTPDMGVEDVPSAVSERAEHEGPFFQTRSIKIFIDGVVEGGTAYLLEPYAYKPGYRGELLWDPAALEELFAALDREGFQLHIHAIGDAATRVALDALEATREANGKRDSRHAITHLQLVSPEDRPRFGELGVIGVANPYWFSKGGFYENIEAPYLGEERASREYPMKSLIDAGAVMAAASDFPVTTVFSPLRGIQQGVLRGRATEVLGPEERASVYEMIESFTIHGAHALYVDDVTGSVEEGKLADLVVVDRDLMEIPPEEIGDARVLLTLFQGKEVYRDPDLVPTSD